MKRYFLLLSLVLLATTLIASCGDGDDEPAKEPEALPSAATPGDSSSPIDSLFPCYIDLAALQQANAVPVSTPEVIEVQVLERPYRIVPSNIVLEQNRQYRFIIRGGNEWHGFRSIYLNMYYDIPPGGQVEAIVQPAFSGVFAVENWRHIRETEIESTITVVPRGMDTSSWHSLCVPFQVNDPPLGTALSTPFVIEGSVGVPQNSDLRVTRIEAWSNGKRVGQTTRERFTRQVEGSGYFLTIPQLLPGSHNLLLVAYLQNGIVAATATMPLTVLPERADRSLLPGYRGNIDLPVERSLHGLPVTIEGWVVNTGSEEGTGIGSVEIWNGPRESGQFLTEAVYGTYRPDVAQALDHPPFVSSGFVAQLHELPAGEVDIHIYVRDRTSGDYVSPRFRQPQLTRRITLAEGKVTDAVWPVALAPAPDGRLFFAELFTGNIRILQDGKILPEPFATLDDVSTYYESGLLGLALHPDFPQEPYVYAMYVVHDPESGYTSGQRVVRFRDENNVGQDYTVILDKLPSTTDRTHNGGRIVFGRDNKLYLSVGDTLVKDLAQDPTRLEGSILRYNPDGSIPDDNPIPGSPVYAIGLRNVFGLAIQPTTGFLYATDNGPGGFDELNKIEAGKNYGWPLHMGAASVEGFSDAIAVYGNWPETPVGPTGTTFSPERPDLLLFCAYHDFLLRAVQLSGPEFDSVESTSFLSNSCALDVTYSSDGWLYYSTHAAIYRARLEDLLRLQEQQAAQ